METNWNDKVKKDYIKSALVAIDSMLIDSTYKITIKGEINKYGTFIKAVHQHNADLESLKNFLRQFLTPGTNQLSTSFDPNNFLRALSSPLGQSISWAVVPLTQLASQYPSTKQVFELYIRAVMNQPYLGQ